MTSRPAPARPDAPVLVWEAPLRLVNLTNERSHWAVKARRAKEQRQVAELLTTKALRDTPLAPPYAITITRIGKGRMDGDGLQSAGKHVRDGIAQALGIDDGDKKAAVWLYEQEKGEDFAVKVVITGRKL